MNLEDGHHRTCEICHLEIALYCCPRCSIRTCSLKCCKTHKEIKKCNGKRDRTAFIALNKFSDTDLLSDFHFLEDALQSSKRAKRLRTDLSLLPSTVRGGSKSKSSHKKETINQQQGEGQNYSNCQSTTSVAPTSPLLQQPHCNDQNQIKIHEGEKNENQRSNNDQCLKNIGPLSSDPLPTPKILQVQDSSQKNKHNNNDPDWLSSHTSSKKKMVYHAQMMRNIKLLLMPKGMQRHIQNTSRYDVKKDIFFWRLEFIFHLFFSPEQRIEKIENKNVDGSSVVEKEIQHIKLAVTVERLSDKANIGNELSKVLKSSKTLKSRVKEYNQGIEEIHNSLMFLRMRPCNSTKPLYQKLDHNESLQNILRGTTIIEYPSIEVLLNKRYISKFPTNIQEIDTNIHE